MTDLSNLGPLIRDIETIRAAMPQVITALRSKTAEHAADAPRREAGYLIENAAGDEAVVRIYDEIWDFGVNAVDLTADLDAITAPTIRVEINSPGGNVFDGIAIYNALRTHPARIVTRVDGIAASIASVIAQAGDHRIMVESSQMMIHNASGLTVGTSSDHEQMAAILAHQDSIIAGVYASNSGKDSDHFRTLMDAETWLTAEAAVAEGLADEILDPSKDKPANRLVDEIAAAVDAVDAVVTSATRVDALRAEAGKSLSGVNVEGLVGLRDAIDALIGQPHGEQPVDNEIEAKRAELAKRANSFRAEVPSQFIA